jgi:hypothetical protein
MVAVRCQYPSSPFAGRHAVCGATWISGFAAFGNGAVALPPPHYRVPGNDAAVPLDRWQKYRASSLRDVFYAFRVACNQHCLIASTIFTVFQPFNILISPVFCCCVYRYAVLRDQTAQ